MLHHQAAVRRFAQFFAVVAVFNGFICRLTFGVQVMKGRFNRRVGYGLHLRRLARVADVVGQGRVEVFGDGIGGGGGDGGQGAEGKGEGKERFFHGVLRRGMYGRFMLSASPPAAP